jgi:hypothetical protein
MATQTVEELTAKYAGQHYLSRKWQRAANRHDWANRWPIIRLDGTLTGAVDDGGEDMINVEDLAVIPLAELPREERQRIADARERGTWDGYTRAVERAARAHGGAL